MARKYTGWDKDAAGKRAGAERWFALCIEFSGGALWNNGSWVVRTMRGKQNPSVHGTGVVVHRLGVADYHWWSDSWC